MISGFRYQISTKSRHRPCQLVFPTRCFNFDHSGYSTWVGHNFRDPFERPLASRVEIISNDDNVTHCEWLSFVILLPSCSQWRNIFLQPPSPEVFHKFLMCWNCFSVVLVVVLVTLSGEYGRAPACRKWFGVSWSGSSGLTLRWVKGREFNRAVTSAATVASTGSVIDRFF